LTLSAHQPCYLPWLGWFNKLKNCDRFVILDDVQLEHGGFSNRSRFIMTGNPYLTIPMVWEGYKKKTIREMSFPDTYWHWPEEHRAKLEANYPKSYWIEAWMDWAMDSGNLVDACDFSLELARSFDIRTDIDYQSHIGIIGHKAELIVNLCRHYGADAFLFGTEGYDNYGQEIEEAGIRAIRQDYTPPDWPPLSVLHYLITVGIEETRRMIQ
jgi:hypothetical protein